MGVVRRFLELLELVQVQVLASVAVLGCLVLGHLGVVVAVVALVRRVPGLLVQVHPLVVAVVVTMHWMTWTSSMYGRVEGRRL